jgi:hypothetical protein
MIVIEPYQRAIVRIGVPDYLRPLGLFGAALGQKRTNRPVVVWSCPLADKMVHRGE